MLVPEVGVEPTRAQGPEDFESSASTNFTTPARCHLAESQAAFSFGAHLEDMSGSVGKDL